MSILSKEEIEVLKASKDEALAALGVKLESAQFIPKDRFDEVNQRQKDLTDKLAKIEADKVTAETERMKRQGEFQKLAEEEVKKREALEAQLSQVKPLAEKFEATLNAKRTELKKQLGDDKWLSVYDNASIEDVDKLLSQIKPDPTTVNNSSPAHKVNPKKVEDMTGAEILQQAQRTIALQGQT